jgi:maltose-binding protein MalE
MKGQRKPITLAAAALIFLVLTVSACNGDNQAAEVETCSGDVFVESETVTRVTPSPNETYADGTTHTWDEPPYGVEVTGSGEAVLRVYFGSTFLSEYRAYAAGVNGYAQFTVDKWNGSKDLSLNVGNYVITDTDEGDVCELDVTAAQVGITSVGTKYVVTVRPEINQVIVGVLEGKVEVTSQGQTVTLDGAMPDQAMVVISNGVIGPLLPIPNQDLLLQEVMAGQDISLEEQPSEMPVEQPSLTLWADERLLPALEEIRAQFEKDTGMQLLIETMPLSDLRGNYAAALRSGNAPDLVTLSHLDLFEFITNGSVLPLKMEINPEILVQGALQAFKYKGEVYGIPYGYENLALVSNPQYISEIPATWNELLKFAAEISRGREFFTSLMIPADGYHFFPVQSAFNGYIFGTTRDGTFNAQDLGMTSEGSMGSAAFLAELVKSQPFFLGNEDDALTYFREGNAAMIVTGPWSLPWLREMGIPFVVNSFPREVRESQPFLNVFGFAISRDSRNPEAAQNLLWKYLVTDQAMLAYATILGIAPARWAALDKLEDPDLRAFGLAGVNGVPIPYLPEMNAVWDPWTDAIRAIISGELSPLEAFRNAEAIIMKEISQ